MGKRRGVLPAGFTALEYIETSGTQYIKVPHKFNDLTGLQMQVTPFSNTVSTYNWPFAEYLDINSIYKGNRIECRSGFFASNVSSSTGYRTFSFATPATDPPFEFSYNFQNSRKVTANGVTDSREIYVMDSIVEGKTMVFGITWDWLNERQNSFSFAGRYYFIRLSQEEAADMALIPVLRNSDGVPGMWDTVSKQFFTNAGTGSFGYRIKGAPTTFALRDPHRVAPSGVYARRIAENELEIVADTEEVTGEGWEWFANTAEAYEHFNIVPSGANEP